jgi:hypothetical protein
MSCESDRAGPDRALNPFALAMADLTPRERRILRTSSADAFGPADLGRVLARANRDPGYLLKQGSQHSALPITTKLRPLRDFEDTPVVPGSIFLPEFQHRPLSRRNCQPFGGPNVSSASFVTRIASAAARKLLIMAAVPNCCQPWFLCSC